MMPFPGDITAVANGALLLAVALAAYTLIAADAAQGIRRKLVAALPALLLLLVTLEREGPLWLAALQIAATAGAGLAAHRMPRLNRPAYAAGFVLLAALTVMVLR